MLGRGVPSSSSLLQEGMPLRFKRDALGGGGRESRAELPSKEEGGQLPEGIVTDAPKPRGRDGTPGKRYHVTQGSSAATAFTPCYPCSNSCSASKGAASFKCPEITR